MEKSDILQYIRIEPYKSVTRPPFHYKARPELYNLKGQGEPYNGEDEALTRLFYSASQLTSADDTVLSLITLFLPRGRDFLLLELFLSHC